MMLQYELNELKYANVYGVVEVASVEIRLSEELAFVLRGLLRANICHSQR